MFELGGTYSNRKGNYTVVAIDGPKMTVRFEDGSEADLNMEIQARIWANIVAEKEAQEATRSARAARKLAGYTVKHYVKIVSIPAGDDLAFPGWQERVVMASSTAMARALNPGDRLIYFALEARNFFAVATITGSGTKANPKKYTYTVDRQSAVFFPIDIDAASLVGKGVALDSVELESQPNFDQLDLTPEAFVAIDEDDFELLAEALTELSEIDDDDLDEEDEEDEDE